MNSSLYSNTGNVILFLYNSWYRGVCGKPVYGLMDSPAGDGIVYFVVVTPDEDDDDDFLSSSSSL